MGGYFSNTEKQYVVFNCNNNALYQLTIKPGLVQ